jgi:hypothetical protein
MDVKRALLTAQFDVFLTFIFTPSPFKLYAYYMTTSIHCITSYLFLVYILQILNLWTERDPVSNTYILRTITWLIISPDDDRLVRSKHATAYDIITK